MKQTLSLLLALTLHISIFGQTNFTFSNPAAAAILAGNYAPSDYAAAQPVTDPQLIVSQINALISPDSLKNYITRLSEFGNRNTGSDTSSATFGIGAARRWIVQKFSEFSVQQEHRLVVSYFQFDQVICSMGQHRNVMAILPGTNPDPNGIVLIEGHVDSRCAGLCDLTCPAEGVEDNASGTALVMELARVMSRFSFKNTLVFMAVTGEEQGLYGADAFAEYAQQNNLPIRAVLNNDVIGGVICGETSSPPSCPGLNNVDSTSVRLFSAGSFNSKHKQLARFIKLEYQEMLRPLVDIPMLVRIMSPEDRTGRGGDHIPFRERNFAAMRFTAANEHGNASNSADYHDRQHTSDDVLGVDTDGDGAVDSFFVQFNYLARNAVINGNAAAMAARAVPTPTNFTGVRVGPLLTVEITDPANIGAYRIALRSTANDWDTVYTLVGATTGQFPCNASGTLFLSVAAVDTIGIESLFSIEKIIPASSATDEPEAAAEPTIRLLQNRPNPFDEATWISCWVNEVPKYSKAVIRIADLSGREIASLPIDLKQGLNEVLYTHGYGTRGTFTYFLQIDNTIIDSRQMIFAN